MRWQRIWATEVSVVSLGPVANRGPCHILDQVLSAGHVLGRVFREAMCEYKVKAAHPPNASHDVDEQRLLTRRFGVFAELLPE